jgi:outer membrane protein TolC
MIKKISLLLFSLSLVASASLPKDLEDYLEKVFDHSSELKIAREELNRKQSESLASSSGFFPSLETNYSYFTEDTPTTLSSENPQETTKLTLRQNLFRGFVDVEGYRAARLRQQAGLAHVEATKINLADHALDIFFQYQILNKDIYYLKLQIDTLRSRVSDQNQQNRIGKIRAAESLSSRAELLIKESEVAELQIRLRSIETQLRELTGADQNYKEFKSKTPELKSKEKYVQYLNDRADIKRELLKKEAAEKEAFRAKLEYSPSLDLSGNYYLDRPRARDDSKWDVTASITLPLFSGFRTYSNHSIKKSQAILQQYQVDLLRRRLNLEFEERYNTVLQYQGSIKLLEEALDLSKRAYEQTRRDYGFGQVSNLDVLQSLRIHTDTARNYNRQLMGLYSSFYKMEGYLGKIP